MKTPHLNALRAVEATLRLGTMAKAAEELGVTPAAIGQQVRLLEDYLQCPLFERRPAGVVPTPAAARVAASLTGAFTTLAGVLADLAGANDPNRVWLTMTEDIAEHWIPVQLPGFLSRYPGVDLRLDGSPSVRPLGPDGFDFAIRSMRPPADTTRCALLFPNREAPVCTPDFARRYNLGPHTERLDGVPICGVTIPGRDPEDVGWATWCARTHIAWSPENLTSEVDQTGGAVRMARAGLALAMASLHSSRKALAEGALVMPFGPGPQPTHDYWYVLLWPAGRRLSPVQRAFRDWIVAAAEVDRSALPA